MNITYKFNRKEYVKATRKHMIVSGLISKTSLVLIPLMWVASILMYLEDGDALSVVALSVSTLAIFVGIVLYFYVPNRNFKLVTKNSEEYHLTFLKDKVLFKTKTINSELDMSIFEEIWRSRDFYYLIQNKMAYSVIPRRVFKENNLSEAEFESVMAERFDEVREI